MLRISAALGAAALSLAVGSLGASAADYPAPQEGDYVIENFTFHDGETLPEMKVHYRTIGDPSGEPVLLVHGTNGSGASFLTDGFAGAMFGPGQPLDATHYFIILPDAIGAGGSSKPSDGMRAAFPRYNYKDMVEAQYQLVKDHLGLDHLRLVMGNSMGGMITWEWGIAHPDFMDALVPMASLPAAMSGRNWMMRRMLVDSVRTDPAWNDGNYTEQPTNLAIAQVWFGLATNGGNMRLQEIGATREKADEYVDGLLAKAKAKDANDTMYQWDASRDFDPSGELDQIKAPVLAINSADDERNPTELGILDAAVKRLPNIDAYIIPESSETKGHGTTGSQAALYAEPLKSFLDGLPE
ncbi:alpha/beta fold hydrolase [Acuticoccus sediminis]|uniref:alpha/beta fold hydrolase n=1 Tax=Acuticoccus sediminis TaxID=2184697 RepID=UPI001CFCB005|nr:alpha/beta fold hydrolase [Acuticoccus sediminis]